MQAYLIIIFQRKPVFADITTVIHKINPMLNRKNPEIPGQFLDQISVGVRRPKPETSAAGDVKPMKQ